MREAKTLYKYSTINVKLKHDIFFSSSLILKLNCLLNDQNVIQLQIEIQLFFFSSKQQHMLQSPNDRCPGDLNT